MRMDVYQELKDAVLTYDALKDTDPFPSGSDADV